MKNCLVLLILSTLILFGCTAHRSQNKTIDLNSRVLALQAKVQNIEQELEQEIQTRKTQYNKLNNKTATIHKQFVLASEDLTSKTPQKPVPTAFNPDPPEKEKYQSKHRKSEPKNRSRTPEELYKHALNTLLKQNNPQKARKKFNKFLGNYPNSTLVPNAIYWLGETFYNQKKYAESILTFKRVYNKFPKDPKALDALLKTGYAYARKGDISNAKFYLKNLIKRDPGSREAKLAQKRLESLNASN